MKTIFFKSATVLLITVVLSIQPVPAAGLHDDLLRIHANLLPKTLIMDYNFGRKLVDDRIVIDLVCMEKNHYYAEKLQQYILEKYPTGIRDIPVDVQIIHYCNSPQLQKPATLYYLLSAPPEQIQKALKYIPDTRLVFAYDPEYLQYGAEIGLHIGRRIKPILNVDALKEHHITLRPALVGISELYYQNRSTTEFPD